MTNSTNNRSDFFYRTLAAVAIVAPMGLVFAAGALPEGLQRGELIVSGHAVVLGVLAAGLAVRAAYALGFSNALRTAASETNSALTA